MENPLRPLRSSLLDPAWSIKNNSWIHDSYRSLLIYPRLPANEIEISQNSRLRFDWRGKLLSSIIFDICSSWSPAHGSRLSLWAWSGDEKHQMWNETCTIIVKENMCNWEKILKSLQKFSFSKQVFSLTHSSPINCSFSMHINLASGWPMCVLLWYCIEMEKERVYYINWTATYLAFLYEISRAITIARGAA